MREATITHLRALVACDTRNPPRAIGSDGIFDYVRAQLPDFDVSVSDHGAGAVSLLALRGAPRLLFNVHLDTVPDSPQWSADPFTLRVQHECAIGLGACDIKGAAAALLAVAQATDDAMALLFTSDEEANDPRCVATFLDSHHVMKPSRSAYTALADKALPAGPGSRVPGPDDQPESRVPAFQAVIVAEPTRCQAVLAHRGIQSVQVRFKGRAGHASGEQQAADSALHQAVRWAGAALDFVAAQANARFAGLAGLRFNIGRIEGGIKANMIAPEAELRFGLRALPTMDPDELLGRLRTLTEPAPAAFVETFRGPSLPGGDSAAAATRRQSARALADELTLPIGGAVDFWTEAALFSAAGYTSFVYGPGAIAQAHSNDEWVALDQLEAYAVSICHMVAGGLT